MVQDDSEQSLVALPLLMYIFLLCERGRKSRLPFEKHENCQTSLLRSHGPVPGWKWGLTCECVTHSKFSADKNTPSPFIIVSPFLASDCVTPFTAPLKPEWRLSRLISQPQRLCSRLLRWNTSEQLSMLKKTSTFDLCWK